MEATISGLGFPIIRGTILGVPIRRTIAFWGLYWGPLILGNYHISAWLNQGLLAASHTHPCTTLRHHQSECLAMLCRCPVRVFRIVATQQTRSCHAEMQGAPNRGEVYRDHKMTRGPLRQTIVTLKQMGKELAGTSTYQQNCQQEMPTLSFAGTCRP